MKHFESNRNPHPNLSLKGEGHAGPSPLRGKVAEGRMRGSLSILLCLFFIAGCNLSPFGRTRDASNGGGSGAFGSGTFVIFNDELVSGGGAFEYPGSEGQVLTFSDTSNPISRRSIRYSWTGEPPGGQPRDGSAPTFAGFDLMHTPTFDTYASTPGRDLRAAGYTKVTFYARGSLSTFTELKIEVSDDGNTATPTPCMVLSTDGTDPHDLCTSNGSNQYKMSPQTLTSSWQQYTMTITAPLTSLKDVKDYFKATYVYTPIIGAPVGQGGAVYFDVIVYQP